VRLRVRLLAALTLAVFVGYFWVSWSVTLGINLVRNLRGAVYTSCPSPASRHLGTPCDAGFSEVRGWSTLVVVALVLGGIGFLVARWVTRPLRGLADAVSRLGPQNFTERVPDAGRDEMGRAASETNALLDRIVAAYESQRRFAANASHELRTPLAVQRALIEVGMSEAPTAEQSDLLARQLLDANRRNEELVEGLLVLAETDRGLVSRTPQRLDEITALVCQQHAAQAAAADVTLTCHTEPVTVAGEAVMLERLVVNLVQNAIKYNAAGGTVQVALVERLLVVTNTGPAVPAALVPGLFEPFRRGQGERLDTRSGSGLGLTIVRSIAAAHDASVTADANTDGGLRIAVRFPG
jgi:signal transduction histidine kinase